MSSWSCEQCTFLNPPSQKSTCLICLSPFPSPPSLISSSSSSSSVPKWSCKACTFLNPYDKPNCEICDSRAPISSLSAFEDLNDVEIESDAAGFGSVFFPLRACKRARVSEPEPASESASSLGFRSILNKKESDDSAVTELEDASSGKSLNTHTIKVLSYNVWFREDLELHKRMKALGDIIELHSPHIICFQEVTPNIYAIFQKSNWWKVYNCSVSEEIGFSSSYFCMQLSRVPVKTFSCRPFPNSGMGRELCISEIEISEKKSMTVATSHLESPCPGPPTWDQMFSKERVAQAKEALDFLRKKRNVIFAGDMNWDDKLDGRFPFPDDDWIDAWLELRPGENGWTYDTKSNKMLSGNRTLQKRLDRFVCKLADFEISQIEMVGLEPIPCVSYIKEKKVKNEIKKLELPVLPSDHFGLLLTICSR